MVGAFLIFFTLIKFTHYSIKNLYIQIKERIFLNQYNVFICAAIIINLWPFIPTGNFFGSSAANLFWLPVGFFLAMFDSPQKK
jgi:hypothetical protein